MNALLMNMISHNNITRMNRYCPNHAIKFLHSQKQTKTLKRFSDRESQRSRHIFVNCKILRLKINPKNYSV